MPHQFRRSDAHTTYVIVSTFDISITDTFISWSKYIPFFSMTPNYAFVSSSLLNCRRRLIRHLSRMVASIL